ncbi:uncharacterized protein SPAPADRAFT_65362 [Spathaspora passalidarum NRRL Y-27907]|uniref:Outer spore wall assembly protein SHE10 n=1 Tax=Spathaspora passalidarum (strain NRRL Y-27907 / 11-Y1) TaxID=619300 RepID=G3AHN6_SPAPN|nr:uncharacterized protein SPAPADRAFT_65362 [Spathaspora passalidarum NRRL Y-27907]EGW34200.1 hypothetical protein SPAPADRAFT_65362 [Spathaspora passalidarum NRRL Y-27907]
MNYKFTWVATVLSIYVFYAWTFVCPLNAPSSLSVNGDLPPVSYHFCTVSNGYLKPIYQEQVIPLYQSKVVPVFSSVNEQFGVVSKVTTVVKFVETVDAKFNISGSIGPVAEKAAVLIKQFLEKYIIPYVEKSSEISKQKFDLYYNIVKNFVVFTWDQLLETLQTSVLPYFTPLVRSFTSLEVVQWAIDWYYRLFNQVVNSKHAAKLQEKSSFLKNEFNNLFKFEEFYPRIPKTRNALQVVKDILSNIGGTNANEESDESDVETVYLTSTVRVTQSNSVATEDPVIAQLQSEILYWENKVNKTVELAMNNLEVEMKPLIDALIEKIKPNISQQLQDLQRGHHLQYQTLNKKISEINRDYEKIKETNDTTIETITRQEIRDDIAASYKLAEDTSESVQKILIDSHQYILEEYFRITQQTIDVLETFSETTMAQFSKRLGKMIHDLELDDDQISWAIWKRFHVVKESLFEFRDFILDSANEYKNTNSKDDKVIGMKVWNEYLRNVEFHLNFLLRDNADYLQLMRAKANIAFQMREGLVYDLKKEEAREQEEQEKKEQARKETLKKIEERMEKEKQEKEIARKAKAEKERIKVQQLEDELWEEIVGEKKRAEARISSELTEETDNSETKQLEYSQEKSSREQSSEQVTVQSTPQQTEPLHTAIEESLFVEESESPDSPEFSSSEIESREITTIETSLESIEDIVESSISLLESSTASEVLESTIGSETSSAEESSEVIIENTPSDDSSLIESSYTGSISEVSESPISSEIESSELSETTTSGLLVSSEIKVSESTLESGPETSELSVSSSADDNETNTLSEPKLNETFIESLSES